MIAKTMCRVYYADIDFFKLRQNMRLYKNNANINIVEAFQHLYRKPRGITIWEVR